MKVVPGIAGIGKVVPGIADIGKDVPGIADVAMLGYQNQHTFLEHSKAGLSESAHIFG
jgi:hypothetical protein